jgi:hypothetical protein
MRAREIIAMNRKLILFCFLLWMALMVLAFGAATMVAGNSIVGFIGNLGVPPLLPP